MSRARLAGVLLLAVLVVAAGALTWHLRPQKPTKPVPPSVTASGDYRVGSVSDQPAVTAAVAATPLALSYNYASLDRNLAAATSRMTPDFAKDFRSTFEASVRPLATQEQAVTRARVRAAGVVGRSGDRVTCLLYVDQVLVSSKELSSGKQPVKVGQNRVIVKMQHVGNTWKVDDITPM